MAYQSLYRRYRPRRFGEIKGQPHVVAALQNAVRDDRVSHAYLLHGPRGTGKTTTARVLAKALNCENLGDDGEPCGTCESCVAIDEGRSFDLHELDAASNNKVDDMRDLLAKVNLGTPGRTKVYLLDEVHMLTPGAENALLKTLEEPPGHVVWVLATTEPHKVVQTIRSRTQEFQLGLLGAEEMAEHVRWVAADAELDVDDDAVEYVVSVGAGSVRDTLSALDRVVAAGGTVELDSSTDELVDAIADGDAAAALRAVGDATGVGRDPRTVGERALVALRNAFLTAMGSPPARTPEGELARARDLAARMSPATLTRAMEVLGTSLVEMRQAPDPRVDLEVALVRLCRVDTDQSVEGLVARIEQLEQQVASGAPVAPSRASSTAASPAPATATPTDAPAPPAAPPSPPRKGSPAAAARAKLAESSGRGSSAPTPSATPEPVLSEPPPTPEPVAAKPSSAPVAAPEAAPASEAAPTSEPAPASEAAPTSEPAPASEPEIEPPAADPPAAAAPPPPAPAAVGELDVATVQAALDRALDELPRRVKTWWGPASVVAVADGQATVSLEFDRQAQRCEDYRAEVESAVAAAGAPVTFAIAVGGGAAVPPADPQGAADDDMVDPAELVDAPDHAGTIIDRLTDAFPGAELVTDEGDAR